MRLRIYSGVFPEPGRNRADERKLTDNPIQPEWGFAWPNNVRVLYNRASADPEGRPWSERKKLVWWDFEKRSWVGPDKPDFELEKPPDYQPPPGATGMAAIAGTTPFITKADGLGWLYSPGSRTDLFHALRAGRVAAGQPALSQTQYQPDGTLFRRTAKPDRPHADSRLSRGGHDVPPYSSITLVDPSAASIAGLTNCNRRCSLN